MANTYLDSLRTARDSLAAKLESVAARPDYTADGQSFNFSSMVDRLQKLNEAIARAEGPVEVETIGQP